MNGSCSNVCPVKINIHEQIYKWRQIVAEQGELGFIKKESMKLAGKVLADPKRYRAFSEGSNRAIDKLPRALLYNPFNAWGKQRELPPRPSRPSTNGMRRNARSRPMSSRDAILAAVRARQPAARVLPEVPLLDAAYAGDLVPRFAMALEKMGGRWLEADASVPLATQIRLLYPSAQRFFCSAVAGMDGFAWPGADAAALANVDVGIVQAAFGVAETGSLFLSEHEYGNNALGYLAQHLLVLLHPTQLVGNLHQAYQRPEWRSARYAALVTGPSLPPTSKAC